MLISLMSAPADKHRWGASYVRQQVSPEEHFRRGNATTIQIVALQASAIQRVRAPAEGIRGHGHSRHDPPHASTEPFDQTVSNYPPMTFETGFKPAAKCSFPVMSPVSAHSALAPLGRLGSCRKWSNGFLVQTKQMLDTLPITGESRRPEKTINRAV